MASLSAKLTFISGKIEMHTIASTISVHGARIMCGFACVCAEVAEMEVAIVVATAKTNECLCIEYTNTHSHMDTQNGNIKHFL